MRPLRLFLLTLCSMTALAYADDEIEAPGYRAAYPNQVIEADQMSISPAKSRKGHFSYGETNASVNATFLTKGALQNSVIAGLRNIHLGLGSKIRPKNTLYGVIGVNSTYTGIEDWNWMGNLVIQPDLKFENMTRSIRYIASLHGRYQVHPSTGLHAGFYAELGMRSSIVRPLLGVDYTWGAWLLQAVFPIKYGVTYQGFTKHAFSLMVRPIYTAVHIHKALHDRPGIACYKNTGAEFRWDYLLTARLNFWVALGSTLGGNLTIGDKNNNHRHHIHLHRAPYFYLGGTWGL